MSNIKSITPIGKHQTYDLEVDHPDHQFYLANGVLTSNSHAVAYAIDSFWTAFFMTYYTDEWVCAYLESMSTSPDKRAKAFGEVKALGYTIVPIDINEAGLGWTALPGKRLMPSMTSCRGIGTAAVEEIIANRPYNSIEELLWDDDFNWRHSKFNKKALDALIKIGAFRSLDIIGEDKVFKNYHHMWKVIAGSHVETVTHKHRGVEVTEDVEVEHATLIKRRSRDNPHEGLKNFYDLVAKYSDTPEWTALETADNMIDVFGAVDVLSLIDAKILAALEHKGVTSIEDVEQGEQKIVWFMTVPQSAKKNGPPVVGVKCQTKNKRDYVRLFASGPSGKGIRLSVWGMAELPEPFVLFCCEVKRDDYGHSTSCYKLKAIA